MSLARKTDPDTIVLLPVDVRDTDGAGEGASTLLWEGMRLATFCLNVEEITGPGSAKFSAIIQTSLDSSLWFDVGAFDEIKGTDPVPDQSWFSISVAQGSGDPIRASDTIGVKKVRSIFGEFWRVRWVLDGGGSFKSGVSASAL